MVKGAPLLPEPGLSLCEVREGLEAATVKTFPSFLLFSSRLSQPGLPWMNSLVLSTHLGLTPF